jgi:hypothetical protein
MPPDEMIVFEFVLANVAENGPGNGLNQPDDADVVPGQNESREENSIRESH